MPEKLILQRELFMKNTDSKNQYDDFEIKNNYEFDGATRGRFYKPKKISTTLRLDNDIILYFKKLASEKKIPYQTLINANLRKELDSIDNYVKEQ